LNTLAITDEKKRRKMVRDRKITTMVALMVSKLLALMASKVKYS
jgi:hypothetical protein